MSLGALASQAAWGMKMRRRFRSTRLAAVLALVRLLASGGCQRQQSGGETTTAAPTGAEREAQIAAQQLAALGGPANAEQQALYSGEFQAVGALGDVGAGEGAWELKLLNDYAQLSRP